ncbi:proton-conducting membrane transporter [bacterium]|nr:MAG: proton-conducting membrane transporter [bacterium]
MVTMIVIKYIGFVLVSIIVGLLFMGIGRKYTARIQRRYGPPFWQSYLDVIKLFSKKSISHHWVMDFGIMMGLAGILATIAFLPIAGYHLFNSMNGNIIIMLYFMTIGSLGMAMGVSASGNPNASIGIARALTMMLGYEIPFVIVAISLIFVNQSSLLSVMVTNQAGGFLHWNIIRYPFGFIAAEMALQGMLGEKPFDAMIAPSEIASGPMVELSGKMMGLAFLQHAAQIFLETAIITNLFLGGASNIWSFFFKMFILYILSLTINAVSPRFKFEDAVKWFWKWPMAFSLIQLLITIL